MPFGDMPTPKVDITVLVVVEMTDTALPADSLTKIYLP